MLQISQMIMKKHSILFNHVPVKFWSVWEKLHFTEDLGKLTVVLRICIGLLK